MNIELAAPARLPATRLQQAAAPFLFFLLGVMFATWASRIPAIRDALQINAGQLGIVLLCGGIGSVLSFPLASVLIGHYGARRAAAQTGGGLLLAVTCLPWMPNMAGLMVCMTAMGAAASSFDVAINAIGAEMEKNARRSTMSLLHAWFCVGSLSGALFGSAMAAFAVAPQLHFVLASAALALPLWYACRALPHDRPDPSLGKRSFALPHGALIVVGIIGFCGAIAEGSIADWSGVFMKDHLQVADGVAPLGYAAFAGMMLASRLLGDRLKDRYGARRVVAVSASIAACGVFGAVLAPNVVLAVTGFAIAGAGIATVFPFVFSAAGRHGPSALAAVATMGYSGGLIGPPIIGFVAHHFGMAMGLTFVGVLNVAVALAALNARALE
ncbi:MAG TPA: MFS transporter [Burkholderiaceae bacterium]|jgi:MFS family permease